MSSLSRELTSAIDYSRPELELIQKTCKQTNIVNLRRLLLNALATVPDSNNFLVDLYLLVSVRIQYNETYLLN